jgi:hypothetical protein
MYYAPLLHARQVFLLEWSLEWSLERRTEGPGKDHLKNYAINYPELRWMLARIQGAASGAEIFIACRNAKDGPRNKQVGQP